MMATLPPELIRHILRYLDDEDLYMCASACTLWYEIVKYELMCRNSIGVYRWPDRIANKWQAVAVLGVASVPPLLLSDCQGYEHIRLCKDAVNVLSTSVLELLIKKNQKYLKQLDFLFLEIECRHVEIILTYSQDLVLNIKLKKIEDISNNSIKTLIDNQELIKGFVIEYIESNRAIVCYPDTRTPMNIILPAVRSIIMFCPGIANFCESGLTSKLSSLTLKGASQLDWASLNALSNLSSLKHFHLENLNPEKISSVQLAHILRVGFKQLYSLGILYCKQTDDSIVASITCKKNLRHLNLDARFIQHTAVCLKRLYSLNKLVTLKLFLIINNVNLERMKNLNRKNWPKLKSLTINYFYSKMDLPIEFCHYGETNNTHQRMFEWWSD